MKVIKKCLLASMLALAVSPSYAGSKYQYSNVKRYYPTSSTVLLMPVDAPLNPAGCENGSYYAFNSSHPNYEEYQKLVLSAKISGFKLGMYVYDDRCFGKYPELYRMFIQ